MKYRKKPIVVDAFKFRIDNVPDWFMDKVSSNEIITTETECSIHTSDGWMVGQKGNYILKDITGKIYPCNADVFEMIYEPVDEDDLIK